jgi:hypothetical protein
MKAFYSKFTAIEYGRVLSSRIPDTTILVYYCPKSKYYYVDWKSIRLKKYEQMINQFFNGKTI